MTMRCARVLTITAHIMALFHRFRFIDQRDLHLDAFLRVITGITRLADDFVGYVHALDDFAEDGVVIIEEIVVLDGDEELAAARTFLRVDLVALARRSKRASFVIPFDLSLDGVT